MSKPTIALVPGAWHTPAHYEPLLEQLRNLGYATTSQQLPSVGSEDPNSQSAASDADFVRQSVLLPELDQGKDVILIMHSYGGSPGSAGAKGLSKTERAAAGQKGGVIALVYLCAFLAGEGDSLVSKNPDGKLHPWVIVDEASGQLDVEDPKGLLYANIDSAAADDAIRGMKQHAKNALVTPSPPPAWLDAAFEGRRAYVKCGADKCIPAFVQDIMVDMSGVSFNKLFLEDAGHSPFLSHPEAVGKFVDEQAATWMA